MHADSLAPYPRRLVQHVSAIPTLLKTPTEPRSNVQPIFIGPISKFQQISENAYPTICEFGHQRYLGRISDVWRITHIALCNGIVEGMGMYLVRDFAWGRSFSFIQ